MKRIEMLATVIALGGCGELYDVRVPNGFIGDLYHRADCEPASARGSIALDDLGHVRAVHDGPGELHCRAGSGVNGATKLEVQDAARIELEVLGRPRAGAPWYVRTRVFDAAGNELAAYGTVPGQFAWSATNAEIHAGTCGTTSSSGCVDEPSSATFVASAPSTTIRVRYLGVTAVRTVRVL